MITPKDKALAITPGKGKVSKSLFGNRYAFQVYTNGISDKDYHPVAELYGTHQEDEAELIADTITTYHSSQMLPSQMLEKLRAAEHALLRICHLYANGEAYREIADEALSTLNLPKP